MGKVGKAAVGCFVGVAILVILLYLLMDLYAVLSCFGKGNSCGSGGAGDVYMGPFFWSPFAFGAAVIIATLAVTSSENVKSSSRILLSIGLIAVMTLPYASLIFSRDGAAEMSLLFFLPISIPFDIAAAIILLSRLRSSSR